MDQKMGLNFQGFESSAFQNRTTPTPPRDYIEDSFQIFSTNNISMLRIPYSWESWELDNGKFYDDLEKISKVADSYNISCIYDNHQWKCSSWLGQGIGMPNSLMSTTYKRNVGNGPSREILMDFWDKWWDRKVISRDNVEGWEAQINFLEDVISHLENRKSTFGFEILNEPQIYHTVGGWYTKVGHFHNYAAERLRKKSGKPIFFNAAISNNSFDNPLLQSQVAPKTKNNLIYDAHMYPPSLSNILFFKLSSFLMRDIKIYIGEFNSNYIPGTLLSKDQLIEYLKLFHRFNVFGWAIWRWYYDIDKGIPAFNLTRTDNDKIRTNTNFSNLLYAIGKI